jgi:MFS family permease
VAASYLAELAPPGRAGRWAGTRSLAYGTAMLGGPLLGTTCYEWSPTLVWAGCLACGALAALAIEHPACDACRGHTRGMRPVRPPTSEVLVTRRAGSRPGREHVGRAVHAPSH